jgi:hypothetical protein
MRPTVNGENTSLSILAGKKISENMNQCFFFCETVNEFAASGNMDFNKVYERKTAYQSGQKNVRHKAGHAIKRG